jgi:hypothetical protein
MSQAMLINSGKYQAEKLLQIQASKAIMVSLQKRKERKRKSNSPEFGRQRWNDGGERAEGDLISLQCCRERRRRRRRRRKCRTSSSLGAGVLLDGGGTPSLSLGPAVKRKGQRSRGRRRHCGRGVKRASLPPSPYLYCRARVVGVVVSVPLPRPFLQQVATLRYGVGRRLL